jgi:hypothetical protein
MKFLLVLLKYWAKFSMAYSQVEGLVFGEFATVSFQIVSWVSRLERLKVLHFHIK